MRPWRLGFGVLGIFLTGLYGSVAGQTNPQDTLFRTEIITLDELNRQAREAQPPWVRVYAEARRLGDAQTAIVALHQVLLENPEPILRDSLLGIYHETHQFIPSIRLGKEILAQNPGNGFALDLLAVEYESNGYLKEAVDMRERLDQIQRIPWNVYALASLQFRLGRNLECLASLEKLLTWPETAQEKIRIESGGILEEISLEAAAWNVKGNAYLAQNQRRSAELAFKKALEIAPGFSLAKTNLREMRAPKFPESNR